MKINKNTTKIILIDVDSLDKNNDYYLYEIIAGDYHYYKTLSDEEIQEFDTDTEDYSNVYYLYERKDFTDREWKIAKCLFLFLWNSSNGTNTCIDADIYEDEGFTQKEISKFANKFGFIENGQLDEYEDGGFEIYWAYFEGFDLNTCNFWEEK